jgi:hypothetical protein
MIDETIVTETLRGPESSAAMCAQATVAVHLHEVLEVRRNRIARRYVTGLGATRRYQLDGNTIKVTRIRKGAHPSFMLTQMELLQEHTLG